ncbi:MAG: regulatory iron-sulfur-containing complex subunit RicT [Erysipelotrichaceae bacterium]|nr:regulatory iron-sulfur-containing complex subunit RicT [Erysipelotrichaceae bacterium]MDD3923932.1 regulatory iron-sulfur-containing complex subunit RicT [Erysipelotrichaceae bacterium]MDD4642691.1 regulatory iron-sulfur-containing complex subunit RicT [Erysipelotrichaceae bacterium]
MENNNHEHIEEVKYPYVVSVKFTGTKKTYYFGTFESDIKDRDFVVVETIRGIELGEAIGDTHRIEDVDVKTALKPILRKATLTDLKSNERNKEAAEEALDICRREVEKLNLDMNLISAEYTLDRSKVIFVYVADDRVDFRELLKELAANLKCRIELRQIGMRDKAKIVGGLGVCGMETCCSRFLNEFDVVSINMAKNQLLALNTQKLSGQCGKLMCCLRYENNTYKELRAGLPKMNSQILYNDKHYRITSMNVLTRQVKIENREEALFLSFDELFPDLEKKKVDVDEKAKEL